MALLRLHSLDFFKLLFFFDMRSVCNLVQRLNCFAIYLRRSLELRSLMSFKFFYYLVTTITLRWIKIRFHYLRFLYLWSILLLVSICKRDWGPFFFLICFSYSLHLYHLKCTLAFILDCTNSITADPTTF